MHEQAVPRPASARAERETLREEPDHRQRLSPHQGAQPHRAVTPRVLPQLFAVPDRRGTGTGGGTITPVAADGALQRHAGPGGALRESLLLRARREGYVRPRRNVGRVHGAERAVQIRGVEGHRGKQLDYSPSIPPSVPLRDE